MDGLQLPGWARDLLEESRVGRLGLIDGRGRPRVLPVTFAFEGEAVWSAVDQKPKRVEGGELARVRWLRERPEATLLVDRYSDDWSQLAWLQLIGKVTILDGVSPPETLVARYAQYRANPPAGPFLRLSIERTAHWRASSG